MRSPDGPDLPLRAAILPGPPRGGGKPPARYHPAATAAHQRADCFRGSRPGACGGAPTGRISAAIMLAALCLPGPRAECSSHGVLGGSPPESGSRGRRSAPHRGTARARPARPGRRNLRPHRQPAELRGEGGGRVGVELSSTARSRRGRVAGLPIGPGRNRSQTRIRTMYTGLGVVSLSGVFSRLRVSRSAESARDASRGSGTRSRRPRVCRPAAARGPGRAASCRPGAAAQRWSTPTSSGRTSFGSRPARGR